MKKRMSINDIKFMLGIALALLALLAVSFLLSGETGAQIQVTIDGEIYGSYSLSENQEIPVIIDGETTNLIVIKDGKADMIEADCPDKLCVHQRSVSKNNESIVCLPNRVVVQVTGAKESEFDSFAK